MAARDLIDRFPGAYATPDLVGREELLAQICAVLRDPTPGARVVFLIGPGGIGKTRLLDAALKEARAIPGLHVANDIIDLYHVPTHTGIGLTEAIFSVMTQPSDRRLAEGEFATPAPSSGPFSQYERERQMFARMRLSGGEVAGLARQREQMFAAFASDLQALALQQRVVLAFDTIERLVYGGGQMPPPIEQIAEVWIWLVESLPRWGHVVLLVAGRPEAKLLRKHLEAPLGSGLVELDLPPFNEAESLAYFDSVVKAARDEREEEIASRVDQLGDDIRRKAHTYAVGRPISLALLVDAFSIEQIARQPTVVEEPELPVPNGREAPTLTKYLEELLIARLRKAEQIGDTVLALGRAPKGSDSDLLARLLDITTVEAAERLDQVRRLSFIKVRPADKRIFLHDEMYALLYRRVYNNPTAADAPQAARAEQAILEYYSDQLEACRRDLDELYAPLEREGREQLDLTRLAEVHTRWQTLLTEVVYYRLRQNPIRGFQRYYRYTREAALSVDLALDVQLQAEMLAFLAERDPAGHNPVIDGLERDLALWVVALRPVVRAFADRKYDQLLAHAVRLRKEGAQLLADGMPITDAALSVWEADALLSLGGAEHFHQAQEKLDTAIRQVTKALSEMHEDSQVEVRKWRARAVLAFAHRVRGYLQRVRGSMQAAVEDYRRAAALWRHVNLRIELALTLNNMAFALSELGRWRDARTLAEEALAMRRQLGPRSPVGLSLNTLALIDIQEGAYISAIKRLESSLALFRALSNEGDAGLALIALADARRRHAGTSQVPTPAAKVAVLRMSCEHASEALSIFTKLGEVPRQIESLINQGIARRDWLSIRREHPHEGDDSTQLFVESEAALRRAAELAGDAILYRKVDALLSLAWLYFFAGRDDLIDGAIQSVEQAIPVEYRIRQETGQPGVLAQHAQVQLWPQLGRLHMLYGRRAFARDGASVVSPGAGQHEALLEAVGHYVLGLEYNMRFSPDSQGLRNAKDEVYEQLKEMTFDEMRAIVDKVQEIEREFNLGESVMRKLLENRALWYEE